MDENQVVTRENMYRVPSGELVGQFWEFARDYETPELAMKVSASEQGSINTDGLRIFAAQHIGLAAIAVEKQILEQDLRKYAGDPILTLRTRSELLFIDLSHPVQPWLLTRPSRRIQNLDGNIKYSSQQQNRKPVLTRNKTNVEIAGDGDLAVVVNHDESTCFVYKTTDELMMGR